MIFIVILTAVVTFQRKLLYPAIEDKDKPNPKSLGIYESDDYEYAKRVFEKHFVETFDNEIIDLYLLTPNHRSSNSFQTNTIIECHGNSDNLRRGDWNFYNSYSELHVESITYDKW